MPFGLKRLQATGLTHFVTFTCYRRLRLLSSPMICEAVLASLENMRKRYEVRVYGFVLMPEHVHLLLSEPGRGTLAEALQSLKSASARVSRRLHPPLRNTVRFWQKRYYDRYMRDHEDFVEKLRYIHRNPVTRQLCQRPEDWPWSSFLHYATGSDVGVEIESEWTARQRSQQTP